MQEPRERVVIFHFVAAAHITLSGMSIGCQISYLDVCFFLAIPELFFFEDMAGASQQQIVENRSQRQQVALPPATGHWSLLAKFRLRLKRLHKKRCYIFPLLDEKRPNIKVAKGTTDMVAVSGQRGASLCPGWCSQLCSRPHRPSIDARVHRASMLASACGRKRF